MSTPSRRPSTSDGLHTPASPVSTRAGFPFPRASTRRGSNASTLSAASLDRRGSALHEASSNAIANLLQPPIVRTGLLPHGPTPPGWKAPTQRDIPPVALTNIPHVPDERFREYLGRIGPLWDSVQRGRVEPEQPPWLKRDKELATTDRFAEALESRMSGGGDGGGSGNWGGSGSGSGPTSPSPSRQASVATLSPVPDTPLSAGPAAPRRRSPAQPRRTRNEPTPLSTIPSVYFDESFHLENPRTFDIVSERAEILRPPPGTPQANGAPRKPLTTNAILQEKLSWYMDTVEVHLINGISSASSGFFAALGSLKELQAEAEQSVAKIQALREDLRRLDREVAVGGLEVAAKRRRRANVGKLATATRQVERVVEEVKRAEELVDEGQFDQAADQMDRLGRLVCGQAPDGGGQEEAGLIDLRPLRALQGLDSGLQELQYRIGAGFAHRFATILLEDLREHVAKVPHEQTLKRWSRQRGIPPTYLDVSPTLREDLLAAFKGLDRAGHTAPATAAYREAVQREMKAIIRRHLPSSTDDDADSTLSAATSTRGGKLSQQEKSSILARNLRALDAADAEDLLVSVYTAVGEALRRVGTQTKVLLDVTSSMTPASTPASPPKSPGLPARSPTLPSVDGTVANGAPHPPRIAVHTDSGGTDLADDLTRALDLSSLLGQAVDSAQTQITKVLKVRNEQALRLPISSFLRYFTLNRLFADECEAVSGRNGQALKEVINAQISGWVQVLGEKTRECVAKALDAEGWNARDFEEEGEEGRLLGEVLAGMERDAERWKEVAGPIWEKPEPPGGMERNGAAKSGPGGHDPRQEVQANGISTPVANGTSSPAPTAAAGKAPPAKPAVLDGTRYLLVPSAISLLPHLTTLLSLLTPLGPSLTPQISSALLETLRLFNSRTSQLILGAGATRVAGLKNITTKHLALSSQAVGFLGALVPYLRECLRRHGLKGDGLVEWDRFKRATQEHQGQIADKLVEIMTTRSATHVRTFQAMDWSSPSSSTTTTSAATAAAAGDEAKAEDEGKASQYMETLTKETLTLHRVLVRHLPDFEASGIMRRIFAGYREQWTKAVGEVAIGGAKAGRSLRRDVGVFEARLGKVAGGADVARELVEVVRRRTGGDGKEDG